jgi:hypothetical protein
MVETKPNERPPFYYVQRLKNRTYFDRKFTISECWKEDNLLEDWLKKSGSHAVVRHSNELLALVSFLQRDIAERVQGMNKGDVLCIDIFDSDKCFVVKGGRLMCYEHDGVLYYLIPSKFLTNGLDSTDEEIQEAIYRI